MKFTRFHLVEAIIFILETSENKIIQLDELFNKLKKIINLSPDEDVLKFQFLLTINRLKNSNIFRIHNNQILLSKNIEENFDFDNKINLQLEKSNFTLKKILIDLKNNKKIFEDFKSIDVIDSLINLIH